MPSSLEEVFHKFEHALEHQQFKGKDINGELKCSLRSPPGATPPPFVSSYLTTPCSLSSSEDKSGSSIRSSPTLAEVEVDRFVSLVPSPVALEPYPLAMIFPHFSRV